MTSKRELVGKLAEHTAEQVAGRRWTITKFGRHEDGYFHARVTMPGQQPVYLHCRYGSWLAPGSLNERAVLKEVKKDVAEELIKRMRAQEKAERKADEPDKDGSPDADAVGEDADDAVRGAGGAQGDGETDAPESM